MKNQLLIFTLIALLFTFTYLSIKTFLSFVYNVGCSIYNALKFEIIVEYTKKDDLKQIQN